MSSYLISFTLHNNGWWYLEKTFNVLCNGHGFGRYVAKTIRYIVYDFGGEGNI
jgi:hypothetical protein